MVYLCSVTGGEVDEEYLDLKVDGLFVFSDWW